MPSFGELMREALEAQGYSLRAACKAMHRDPAYPSRVRSGKEAPSLELARDLDALLGGERFVQTLTAGDRPSSQDACDALAAVELARQASISEVGGETIDLLEATFDDLAIQYQGKRPTDLYPAVADHLGYIGRLLGKRTTLREHLALLHLGGWYSLLAATLKIDLADTFTAEAQLRTAVSLSREAGTPVIAAWATETDAWASLSKGDFSNALRLSRAAEAAAPAGSWVEIQAVFQQGRASARLGQVAETRQAIARVESLATRDPEQARHHFQFDPSKQLSYRATALAWSGDVEAERAAMEVIAVYPGESDPRRWPRRLATAQLDRSLALAKRGELDEAAGVLGQVIKSGRLVPATRWRAAEVIELVRTRLPDEAAELDEMLADRT